MIKRMIGKKIIELPEQKQPRIRPLKRSEIPNKDNRLSVSKMQLFEKCPYAYKLRYIDEVVLEDPECVKRGKKLHEMFYYASLSKHPEVIRTFKDYRDFPEDCENFIRFSRKMLLTRGTSIPFYAEKEIFDKENNVLLYIDRVDKVGDFVDILDYKTGKYHELRYHHFQLAFYTYFIEKQLGVKVRKWGIFFSASGKYTYEKAIRPKVDMIPGFVDIIRDKIIEAERNKHFPKRFSLMCRFCPYRHFGLCAPKKDIGGPYFGILDIFGKKW